MEHGLWVLWTHKEVNNFESLCTFKVGWHHTHSKQTSAVHKEPIFNSIGAETEIFHVNWADAIETLDPCITGSSATMVLNMQEKQALVTYISEYFNNLCHLSDKKL